MKLIQLKLSKEAQISRNRLEWTRHYS